jgi:hypothetical protein
MKKIKQFLLVCLGIIAISQASAQGGSFIISPGSFTAEDEITIRVNVTGTGLAGVSPVYIWNWSNLGGMNTNGDWTSSSESRKMTNVGANLWEFKFTPSAYYGVNPGDLQWIGFLVKAKDGNNGKSSDFAPNAVDPLIFTPTVNRVFPARIGKDDISTIYFDQTLASDLTQQRMEPATVEIKAFDLNGAQIGAAITRTLKKMADKQFNFSFIPSALFSVPANVDLSKFEYQFKGTERDANGNPIPSAGPVYSKSIDPLK